MREVKKFAEQINAPVAMTLLGLGALPGEPSAQHRDDGHARRGVGESRHPGSGPAPGVRHALRRSRDGNLKTYAVNAKKIHIDIDPSEIHKNVHADAAICADLREALKDLLDVVGKHDHEPWLKYIGSMKGTAAVRDIQTLPDNGHLYAPHVINDIWRITDGNAIIATDVGQHQMWEAQYYKHESPRTLITSGGSGTMGFGLPAAIGAKMARPDAEVWAIVGDGGFQMTQAELTTARAGRREGQRRHHQQRLPRDGSAVAGVLLRSPLCRHAAAQPGLREAGRGARAARPACRQARRRARRRRARPPGRGHGGDGLPRRAGGQRVPDGARRRRPARDDQAAGEVGPGGDRADPIESWLRA
jgi:hypothetical protein